MGSIVKAKNFPENIREAFVRAFGRIKQKVLWKYENETLPNKPDNVRISSWIPQRDIMTHPNVKLFISHGGYLGSTEAVSEGIPILGLPMYGDQGVS
jgi:glucuronosyltransferase